MPGLLDSSPDDYIPGLLGGPQRRYPMLSQGPLPSLTDRIGGWFTRLLQSGERPSDHERRIGSTAAHVLGLVNPAQWGDSIGRSVGKAMNSGKREDIQNVMATFIGPIGVRNLAAAGRPAAQEAMTLGQALAAKGAPREQIWSETAAHVAAKDPSLGGGVMQGADKKWRFEIDDAPLSVRDGRGGGLGYGPIHHQTMAFAYPNLAGSRTMRTDVRFGNRVDEGSYLHGHAARDGTPYPPELTVDSRTAATARPTTAHELQHASQDIESFARGGNPTRMGIETPESKTAREQIDKLKSYLTNPEVPAQNIPAIRAMLAERERDLEGLLSLGKGLNYHRLAGEVEARTAEKRLALTPEERRGRPAWLDHDTPEMEQGLLFR